MTAADYLSLRMFLAACVGVALAGSYLNRPWWRWRIVRADRGQS